MIILNRGYAGIKRAYFVGIKGVGMTSLALLLKERGFEISGSDVTEEFLTDEKLKSNGIRVDSGFGISDLADFVQGKPDECLVIATAAHNGLLNPQSQYALDHTLVVLTHGQAVGELMKGELCDRTFEGVSVLGCHGKTTIAALAATALEKTGFDPSYTVGTSEIFPLGNSGHLGKGPYFIAEADEFISDIQKDRTVKFLYQHPQYAILNNIDFDHPDVYKNLGEVIEAFLRFCLENVEKNGVIIANGDDKNICLIYDKVVERRADITFFTYGEQETNDFVIKNFKEIGWGSTFNVLKNGILLGDFKLSIPGFHNAKNALSVIALLDILKVEKEVIQKSVGAFLGTKRRQEKVGVTTGGAEVIDDYAHHPDEITKTLTAVKKAYPDKKIAAVFQPHTVSRTKALVNEFGKAFQNVDEIVFLPIFASKREGEEDYSEIYDQLKQEIEKNTKITFLKDERAKDELNFSPFFSKKHRSAVVEYILREFNSSKWIVITLGAGDIYRVSYDLVHHD